LSFGTLFWIAQGIPYLSISSFTRFRFCNSSGLTATPSHQRRICESDTVCVVRRFARGDLDRRPWRDRPLITSKPRQSERRRFVDRFRDHPPNGEHLTGQ
jgi:hypothetical protein